MNDPYGVFERLQELYLMYYESPFALRDERLVAERRLLLESEGGICRGAGPAGRVTARPARRPSRPPRAHLACPKGARARA